MDTSRYDPPGADLGKPAEMKVPEAIHKKIKAGWIAAIISGVMTLVVTVVTIASEASEGLVDWLQTIDVILIFALAYGIYRKSRFAATFMLLYFALSKLLVMSQAGILNGLLVSLIFLYFYGNAAIGTYQYHKLKKAQKQA